MKVALKISDLKKQLDAGPLYAGLSLRIATGEIVSLLGPNGCGKSTLLNIVTGMAHADSGSVSVPGSTRISDLQQNYRISLLPWKTGFQNVSLPLQFAHAPQKIQQLRTQRIIRFFDLDLPLDRSVGTLSGGQQQVVALYQALAGGPGLLLADEALSALDFERKIKVIQRLRSWLKKVKCSALFVSHDIDEALQLSDRVLLLSKSPTTLAHEILVDQKMSRNVSFLESGSFRELRQETLTAFLKEAA